MTGKEFRALILGQITTGTIAAALAYIESKVTDQEKAHIAEDALRNAVLVAIGQDDCKDPQALARAVLESGKIKFARWHA